MEFRPPQEAISMLFIQHVSMHFRVAVFAFLQLLSTTTSFTLNTALKFPTEHPAQGSQW
jgi:hypothetical protein